MPTHHEVDQWHCYPTPESDHHGSNASSPMSWTAEHKFWEFPVGAMTTPPSCRYADNNLYYQGETPLFLGRFLKSSSLGYFHQLFSGVLSRFSVYAPDC